MHYTVDMQTPTRPPPLSLSNLTYVNANTPGAFSPLPNNGITSPTAPNSGENNSANATNVNGRLPRSSLMNKFNNAAVPEGVDSADTDPVAPEENQEGGSRKSKSKKSKKAKKSKSKKSKKAKSKKNVRRN
jgi:hypothetical protein